MRPTTVSEPVLHVDMDAFYVSVELRRRPELRGLPVVVAGGDRGVVLSASYSARASGITSAMPTSRARRLCPGLVVIPPDPARYAAVSAAVMATFRAVTPLVEPLSLDEAFLDVSGAVRRLGTPVAIAEWLRARIADEQQIPCSVGVAPTKLVAKLASRRAKPDGMLVVRRDRVTGFLHPLPVEALWGVGERTAQQLHRLGLPTVGDLAHVPLATLRRALGPALGDTLHAVAWGRDGRRVTTSEPARSVGAEETFDRDTDDPVIVLREVLRLSVRVSARLRSAGLAGRTVTLTVRFADFTTLSRSRSLREPTDVTTQIHHTAAALFAGLGLERARVRLVGVRVEGLVDSAVAPRQLLLGAPERGWPEADRAVDRATLRFGTSIVRPASLLTGRRQIRWGQR